MSKFWQIDKLGEIFITNIFITRYSSFKTYNKYQKLNKLNPKGLFFSKFSPFVIKDFPMLYQNILLQINVITVFTAQYPSWNPTRSSTVDTNYTVRFRTTYQYYKVCSKMSNNGLIQCVRISRLIIRISERLKLNGILCASWQGYFSQLLP